MYFCLKNISINMLFLTILLYLTYHSLLLIIKYVSLQMKTDDHRRETTHFDEMKYKSWGFRQVNQRPFIVFSETLFGDIL